MTAEDIDPEALTPEDMAQLRAEFQALGMTPANAAEAADILARMGPCCPAWRASLIGCLQTRRTYGRR